MAAKLQILICTYGARLEAIQPQGMPVYNGVEYIVSCQYEGPRPKVPETLRRHDISVFFFNDKGLSINRNHALDIASAPYIMIADDDLSWSAAGIRAVIDAFEADPRLDIVTFRTEMPEKRVYPPHGHNLATPWKHYSAISFEIALRRKAVAESGLRFSPLAGIGAPVLACGEEELFLHNAVRKGLQGKHIARIVVEHPADTTSVRMRNDPGVLRAKGALMRIIRGYVGAAIRLPLEAARAGTPFFHALRMLVQGYVYSIKHRHEL